MLPFRGAAIHFNIGDTLISPAIMNQILLNLQALVNFLGDEYQMKI